mmetsp:Transcript_21495/g.45944  ORF Transcript_21495/g.45944 Transcript_21495/m.45944 type:complete len:326 (+) Transcript_21495:572-1549(+)
MTPSVDDAAHPVDERIVRHPPVDEFVEFLHVIPPPLVVALEGFQPVEHAGDPLQFLVLPRRADDARVLAEVHLGISAVPSFLLGPRAQVVVELAEVANSCRLYDAPSPPTTTLHVRPPVPVGHRPRIIVPSRLLPLVHVARPWRVRPRIVAGVRVVPNSGLLVLRLGSAEERSRGAVPLGVRRARQRHLRIYLALHVTLVFRAVIVLIILLELSARVGQGVHHAPRASRQVVPVVLVAGVVLYRLLHALTQERRDVGEAVEVPVRASVAEVEVLLGHSVLHHDSQTRYEALVAVHRGGFLSLIEEDAAVYAGSFIVEHVINSLDC